MALIDNNGSRELLGADASGQLVIHAPTTAPLRQPRRKSRWPARLDMLQSASGLFLALFLMAHMFFVSSILISHDAFYTVPLSLIHISEPTRPY